MKTLIIYSHYWNLYSLNSDIHIPVLNTNAFGNITIMDAIRMGRYKNINLLNNKGKIK